MTYQSSFRQHEHSWNCLFQGEVILVSLLTGSLQSFQSSTRPGKSWNISVQMASSRDSTPNDFEIALATFEKLVKSFLNFSRYFVLFFFWAKSQPPKACANPYSAMPRRPLRAGFFPLANWYMFLYT